MHRKFEYKLHPFVLYKIIEGTAPLFLMQVQIIAVTVYSGPLFSLMAGAGALKSGGQVNFQWDKGQPNLGLFWSSGWLASCY